MIRYLIVDDEPLAHEILLEYSQKLPHLHLVGQCYSAFEAMECLRQQGTDLMLLDLNMPGMQGFDFLRSLPHPPQIIVTTAYEEFALEAFRLNVIDYLLKPFRFERFVQAIQKYSNPVSKGKTEPSPLPLVPKLQTEHLFIKGDKRFHQIRIADIRFIEAFGNYVKVYVKDQMLLTHRKISDFEKRLPQSSFLRVHKSFIVSIPHIEQIEGNRILIGECEIPIGQTYRPGIHQLLN
ncbi:MAG: LytTR family DNA-binding domain-containing protein [Bacteroidota bacterium]